MRKYIAKFLFLIINGSICTLFGIILIVMNTENVSHEILETIMFIAGWVLIFQAIICCALGSIWR